jgi:ketosteroid isomerase-like protein
LSEHPNALLYREAMERFNAGDPSVMIDAIADDVVWWQIGSPEPIRGKEALLAGMEGLSEMDISVDVTDVVADDDMVVGLVTATVGKGPDAFSYNTVEVAWLKDGKVVERRAYSDDTEAINNFFSQFG